MITFTLSEDLQMIQKTAADFARQRIRPVLRQAEAAGAVDADLSQAYAELGFGLVDVPEAHGGLGLGMTGRAIVEEALAYGDIGVAMAFPSAGPLLWALEGLGTDAQRTRILSKLAESGGRGAVAWTDAKPVAGGFSAVAHEQDDGSFRLNGLKGNVLGGDRAEQVVVFAEARLQNGRRFPAAFVVESSATGVRWGEPTSMLGLGAVRVAQLTLEHVHVAADDRLSGADDEFDRKSIEMLTRIGVVGAARAVGLARASLTLACEWAEDRKAFGKPIAHFQGLAFLIADMATTVEVMQGMVYRAASAFDRGLDDALKLGAMAIAECHEGAMFVTNNGVQVLGGSGFVRDYPAEKWMRDAKAHMAHALPRQVCDLLIGRLSVEGEDLRLVEDAPLPQVQPVMI